MVRGKVTSILLCLAILVGGTNLLASSVRLIPAKPKMGNTVTIRYTAGEKLSASLKIYAYVYLFPEHYNFPRVEAVEMRKTPQGEFEGVLKLGMGDVFGLMKFTDGREVEDNNNGKFWDFLVTADFENPVSGAHYRRGASFLGGLPQQCQREVNFDTARYEMEQELKTNPQYLPAKVALLWLQHLEGELSPQQLEEQMRKLLTEYTDYGKPHFLKAAIQGWKMLRDQEKVRELEDLALELFPESELAQEIQAERLFAEKLEQQELTRKVVDFLSTYPAFIDSERIQRLMVNRFIREGNLAAAYEFLRSIPNAHPQGYILVTRYQLQQYVMTVDTVLKPQEKQRLEEMAEFLKTYVESPLLEIKPPYLTLMEWEQRLQLYRAEAYFVYALAQKELGNMQAALEAIKMADQLYGEKEPSQEFFENLISLSMAAKDYQTAFWGLQKAIVYDKATDSLKQLLRPLYDSVVGKGPQGYQELERHLEREKDRYQKRKLLETRLDRAMIDGELKTLNGKTVRLSDFKGKILVLDFWATWCGPCKASFPVLQQLYDSLKNDGDVQFFVINAWERVANRDSAVRSFLAANNYTFPVYLDEKDELIRAYGVTGIPTKIFIDKEGRIQFKEMGFFGEERSKKYFLQVIEVLRDPAFYRE